MYSFSFSYMISHYFVIKAKVTYLLPVLWRGHTKPHRCTMSVTQNHQQVLTTSANILLIKFCSSSKKWN